MKAQHTPGPWEVIGDSNGWYSIGENQGDGLPVVRIDEDNVFPPRVREANARIIAASPDMHVALKAIQGVLSADDSPYAVAIALQIAEDALLLPDSVLL